MISEWLIGGIKVRDSGLNNWLGVDLKFGT